MQIENTIMNFLLLMPDFRIAYWFVVGFFFFVVVDAFLPVSVLFALVLFLRVQFCLCKFSARTQMRRRWFFCRIRASQGEWWCCCWNCHRMYKAMAGANSRYLLLCDRNTKRLRFNRDAVAPVKRFVCCPQHNWPAEKHVRQDLRLPDSIRPIKCTRATACHLNSAELDL